MIMIFTLSMLDEGGGFRGKFYLLVWEYGIKWSWIKLQPKLFGPGQYLRAGDASELVQWFLCTFGTFLHSYS